MNRQPDLDHRRACAALLGLAVGDALGMPTQTWSRAEVARRWPRLDGFVAGPADQPVAPGMPAGHVTDDTEQALLLGRLLVAGDGRLEPRRWGAALLEWERVMRERGSRDLLGPSTRRAVAALAAGADPRTTGRAGHTNGAAMRIAPVGISVPAEPLGRLVEAVEEADRPTHDTPPAHAGAAAVAAAVSAGVDGGSFTEALPVAVAAAREGGRRGTPLGPPDVHDRIAAAVALVGSAPDVDAALDAVERQVGTSLATRDSVPAAFAVAALHPRDAWAAGLAAASLGGDSDTIAAMACAVVGACGGRLPDEAVRTVQVVNDIDVGPLVDGLLRLRQAARP